MKAAVVCLFVLVAICSAELFSDRNYSPLRWTRGARSSPNAPHYFRIFLKQRNQDQLTDVFHSVSDPESPYYGKFWTTEQILDLVAPSQEDHDTVVDFLVENGVDRDNVISFRDSLKIVAPVHVVERVFSTKLYQWTRTDGHRMINRQWGTSELPQRIIDLIDIVTGVDDFEAESKRLRKKKISSTEDVGYVVPTVIRNVYNLPGEFEVAKTSSICLAEFQSDSSFEKQDLKYFQEQTLSQPTPVSHIVGPYNPNPPNGESTLDVQYATAIGLNTTMWFWTTAGWMLDFTQDFFNAAAVPKVVSMSWGWTESAQCQIVNCNSMTSKQYVDRTSEEFKKIGVRGVSLFASSGDQGAPGDGDPYCQNFNDPISSLFPAASPYVTAVGATMLVADNDAEVEQLGETPPICNVYKCATTTKETTCSYPTALITSGGGFSAYASMPSWQSKYVNEYLNSGVQLPPSQYFNKNNRAFPDVAALGHNYPIRIAGEWEVVDGTSCSSPVFAAVFSLLNDISISKRGTPLGFGAPLLYKIYESDKSAFNDITTGNNKCTESCCDQYGYNAARGWDPATGLGTPNFAKLVEYVRNM
jgi:subtilase family serine protease